MLIESSKKVEPFLTYSAVEQNVAPSTQNQALNALVYCYSKVLQAPFTEAKASRSRKESRIPVVLTKEEVGQVLPVMEGSAGLITKLLYASGLRITEAVRLRVQDIDFDQSVVNKAIKRAVKQCGIDKQVSAHTFRHSFATHLLQTGIDIRTIQLLLGHADLQTTMIYTHVLKQGRQGVVSPFDSL